MIDARVRRARTFLGIVLLVCVCFGVTGQSAAKYLPVVVEAADLAVLAPRAWEQNGDIVVSWGLYNPLATSVIPGLFTVELVDEHGRVSARSSGQHLLQSQSILAPGERAAEYGVLQGAAGQGTQVRLRFAARQEVHVPVRPRLHVEITAIHGYLADGRGLERWELEMAITNNDTRSITADEAVLQMVFYSQDYGTIGSQALHWWGSLAPGDSQHVRILTGPVFPGWLPGDLGLLTAYGPAGLQIHTALE